jgi:hypothetical protein
MPAHAPDALADGDQAALLLSAASAAILDVFRRATQEAAAAPVLAQSPALVALRNVVTAINTGTSLDTHQTAIASLIHAQDKRAELVDTLLLTNDYERAVNFAEARAHLEKTLLAAVYREDLTPSERLLLLDRVTAQEQQARNRIKGGAFNNKDLVSLLEKVDFATQDAEGVLAAKFAGTTPAGREIIRKVATRLGKNLRLAKELEGSDVVVMPD